MKLKVFLIFILIFFKVPAQSSINIVVFPSLRNIDFTSIIPSNELQNNVRIFCVEISPQGQEVYIKGLFEWQKVGSNSFVELGNFETKNFTARDFCNDELGSQDISIKKFSSKRNLIDENIRIGVPSGVYRITLNLFDSNSQTLLAQDTEELTFLNPSQTLQIINPKIGLTYDHGNVIIDWTPLNGVDFYSVKVNRRLNPNQSLEEALNLGTPLVNDRNVGAVTSVNLRDILERELEPGTEVVVQVTAHISGPFGGNRIFSPIINFYIQDQSVSSTNTIYFRLINSLRRLQNSQLLTLLENNQINISEIRVIKDDGSFMSLEELVDFLESNSENILRIETE